MTNNNSGANIASQNLSVLTKTGNNGLFLSNVFGFIYICLISLLVSLNANAQLSPGKLSKGHAKLEGISNCTQCHALGDKVSNQKCLACHKELNAQVSKNKGFHVSAQVKGKECIVCHSDHHGVNFDPIRFDKKTFNHNATGYELKGAHKTKVKDCKECHKADNIANQAVKQKVRTFLGLDSKCLTCHDDYHQKTLSGDCASCHNFEKFKPASLFDHNDTDFNLVGAHKKVNCDECHKSEMRNGKKFMKYSGVAFSNCNSCHKDPHKGDFGTNCKSCHNEESFSRISPTKNFNHSTTGFELEGKHKQITCKKCHENVSGNSGNFKEFAKFKEINCLTCHKDVHENKFGNDCKSCHNQNSFLLKSSTLSAKFDHNKTTYPLKGKHEKVDCRVCHKKDLTDPLPHNTCMDCHADKHNGDFEKKKDKYPDCASCHTVDGFTPSQYSIDMHNKTKYKLEGAHMAQPCFSCHLVEKKWKFSNLGSNCVDCHKDIHKDIIDQKHYGKQSCSTCHSTESWQTVKFDHATTEYPLVGGHAKTKCGECHINRKDNIIKQTFKGLTKQCNACHKDVHWNQFQKNGVTDCSRCHSPESWSSKNFNHDNTNYKLDGKHINVSCGKCHKATVPENKSVKLYKIEKYKCIDCHSK